MRMGMGISAGMLAHQRTVDAVKTIWLRVVIVLSYLLLNLERKNFNIWILKEL